MIEIESSVQHSLGQETAVARMHDLVSGLTQRFPQQVHQVQLFLQDHRIEVRFAAYGYIVQWKAEVFDDQVSLTGKIPKTAAKFKGKIEQAILARVEETLAFQPVLRRAA